jgi:phosphatidylserine/phosphatidylglycerophosphate/cardiolipin synthase-like enzyme
VLWRAAAVVAAVATLTGAASSSGLGPLIVEPDQTYAPLYTLLRSAKTSVDLTMYELRDPQVVQALVDDVQRKVAVRVLLDKAYSGGTFNPPVFKELQADHIPVRWASAKVAITHQKSFVIDKKKAVIMTGNFTAQYYATARDYALVDTKQSDVTSIEATFALDWANASGTAPAGADLVWSPGAQDALVGLIGSAKQTLRVESEELKAPAIVTALETAAGKGVDVEVLMTRQKAWATAFDALKKAGVKVRTYKDSTKVLYIHAKAIVVDSKRAFLGSQNFSFRSMQQNRELGLITSTKKVVDAVQTTFAKDFAGATAW